MKMHPYTPIVAIFGLTVYGISLAVVGLNSTITIIITSAISGLGGLSLRELGGIIHNKETGKD